MDFSFRVQASTKAEAKRLAGEQLSAKSVDRKAAIAACHVYVDMLDTDDTKDYVVSASGSVGVKHTEEADLITNTHISLSALTVER